MSEYVYPPSEDTYLLLEAAEQEVESRDSVLEVGAGSGVVASELESMARSVIATDLNPYAVHEVRQKGVEVVRTDLYAGIDREFDLILFNPPYLPEFEDYAWEEPWMDAALEGGDSGLAVVREFLDGMERITNEESRILVVVSSLCEQDTLDEVTEGYDVQKLARDRYFFEELSVMRLTFP